MNTLSLSIPIRKRQSRTCFIFIYKIIYGRKYNKRSKYLYYYEQRAEIYLYLYADSDSNGWRSDVVSTGVSVSLRFVQSRGRHRRTFLTQLPTRDFNGKSGAEFIYSEEISLKDLTAEIDILLILGHYR